MSAKRLRPIARRDVDAIRALIEFAPEECRYHGARLTRRELNFPTRRDDPCCGTGEISLCRRRAAAALHLIEEHADA